MPLGKTAESSTLMPHTSTWSGIKYRCQEETAQIWLRPPLEDGYRRLLQPARRIGLFVFLKVKTPALWGRRRGPGHRCSSSSALCCSGKPLHKHRGLRRCLPAWAGRAAVTHCPPPPLTPVCSAQSSPAWQLLPSCWWAGRTGERPPAQERT